MIKLSDKMIKLSDKVLRDEASMRMVYAALGIRPAVTEAAIQVRRERPVAAQKPASPNGKKKGPSR